ncbi:MAG: hypothetical protein II994_07480 [Lachnospiraceae bacterium]|nr:hypothetical protein [Lachnospiraceae bacterium]
MDEQKGKLRYFEGMIDWRYMRKNVYICIALICVIFMVACGQNENDDVKIYSSEDIYLKSWECGYLGKYDIPNTFPIIIETEEQLAYAEQYYSLHEISEVFDEMIMKYPIEQYTYMILYNQVSTTGYYYHADRIEISEDFINFGMDKESHSSKDADGPQVMGGFIHVAAIPKEYMKECDYSGMSVVIPGE